MTDLFVLLWGAYAGIACLISIGLTSYDTIENMVFIIEKTDNSEPLSAPILGVSQKPIAMVENRPVVQEKRIPMATQPPKPPPSPNIKIAKARTTTISVEQLPLEDTLIADSNLSMSTMTELLSDKKFDDTFSELEQQMFRDPLATELGATYNEEINKKLFEDKTGSTLTKLACGLKLCIGSVHSLPGFEYKEWTKSFEGNQETPYSSVGYFPSKANLSGTTTRFIFSTDPNVNGIRLPPGTPMPNSLTGTILPAPSSPEG